MVRPWRYHNCDASGEVTTTDTAHWPLAKRELQLVVEQRDAGHRRENDQGAEEPSAQAEHDRIQAARRGAWRSSAAPAA